MKQLLITAVLAVLLSIIVFMSGLMFGFSIQIIYEPLQTGDCNGLHYTSEAATAPSLIPLLPPSVDFPIGQDAGEKTNLSCGIERSDDGNRILKWSGALASPVGSRCSTSSCTVHCISGNIRSFVRDEVFWRIRHNLVEAFSPLSDVILVLEGDNSADGLKGGQDEYYSDCSLAKALEYVRATRVVFSTGQTQAQKWVMCINASRELEQQYHFSYSYFVRSRPDFLWTYPTFNQSYIDLHFSEMAGACNSDLVAVLKPHMLPYWKNQSLTR